jgi:hypothetical protein
VNARVGHILFPVGQENILRRQTLELMALQGVALNIFYAGFHFSLMAGHGRFGW